MIPFQSGIEKDAEKSSLNDSLKNQKTSNDNSVAGNATENIGATQTVIDYSNKSDLYSKAVKTAEFKGKSATKDGLNNLNKFSSGDYVVYPAHGLGKINSIESFEYGSDKVTMISIAFERDRMTVKVPVYRVEDSGLRPLSSQASISSALEKLRSKTKAKRTMWARRAQEYESKISSGNPTSIAEVLRELHRNTSQGKPSFSERQIYQAALSRLASELAVIKKIDEEEATQQLVKILGGQAA